MGACNCGHLAQTITSRSREEIHRLAIEKAGDWGEHAVEYCPTSGYPIDHILGQMLEVGLELGDVEHLEKLSDPRVLRRFEVGRRDLSHRDRADVVRYMEEWADMLEERLVVRKLEPPAEPRRPEPVDEPDDEAIRRTG
jgi:hypothetical protein